MVRAKGFLPDFQGALEENDALERTAAKVERALKNGSLTAEDLDPGIAMLLKLQKAGLLEAHILISLSDKDIAKDYSAYRESNCNKLRQYLDEFIVPKIATN